MKKWITPIIIVVMFLNLSFSFHIFGLFKDMRQLQHETLVINNRIITSIKTISEIALENRETLELRDVKNITVSAYTPSKKECNEDNNRNAIMKKPRPGDVAISRDLLKEGWNFGDKVYILGHGIFRIADLMNKRYTNSVDILVFDVKHARKIGRKKTTAALLKST
jgi:3D (Asp-Asp-Asp) domain-containing protein